MSLVDSFGVSVLHIRSTYTLSSARPFAHMRISTTIVFSCQLGQVEHPKPVFT